MTLRVGILAIAGIGVVLLAVVAAGVSPIAAARELIAGSMGSPGAWNGTLKDTTPLLIAGLAVYVALRAGLFNIGVEGQLIVGAMACAVVALAVPGVLGIALGVAAGTVCGGLWALPAGLIKAYRGGHEVITTIMLNSVALFFTHYMVAGPIQAPGQQNTTTARLAEATMLPVLYSAPPLRVSSAILAGLLLLGLFTIWLRRTVSGYELGLVGANPRAAELAGVATKRVIVRSMLASGAISGLAGALQVLAYEGRFYADFSPGYGFDALGVALLAGASPLGLIPAAFLFGVLSKGSSAVQLIGVPKGISLVVIGLLIVVFAAVRFRRQAAHE